MDNIYTPRALASLLVASSTLGDVDLVADLAAGDGALLSQASLRWKGAKLYGGDLDGLALRGLKRGLANVTVFKRDLFAPEEHIPNIPTKFDVVLLNPPFTCRGNSKRTIEFDGHSYTGSTAMAFLVAALSHVASLGELLAIIPTSCLHSDKDHRILRALNTKLSVRYIDEDIRAAFRGYSVNVALLVIKNKKVNEHRIATASACLVNSIRHARADRRLVRIARGSLPTCKAEYTHAGTPFIHTTNLRDRRVQYFRHVSRGRLFSGVAVLIPRVGKMTRDKVCVKSDTAPIVLSDCVIALQPADGDICHIVSILDLNFAILASLYKGSCAPYITIARVCEFLRSSEFEVVEYASSYFNEAAGGGKSRPDVSISGEVPVL